ncbi:cytochrome c oxidase subunit 2 [Paraburkholderia rhizosphaerae]|uniref:cytochrome-c oxidase n=1 Tax=Paraburkholderia rhizosphaerae TaxID=480658 RepID=A0A4R8L8I2_9BURK|nr:cytochrome c oxidase subunit 2 [Paraburkholderia rhizosphaerae]
MQSKAIEAQYDGADLRDHAPAVGGGVVVRAVVRRHALSALLLLSGLASIAVAADARGAPLNYFLHAAGPAAAPTMHLGWALTALSMAVIAIVAVLLAIAIARRRRAQSDGTHVPGETGALRWIYIGTGISSVLLIAALAYTLVTLDSVAAPPRAPSIILTVTAYDWWWKVEYSDADGGPALATANEIHIPVGEPVKIVLKSADVIHAFWVPHLAGKTQTIPGQINEQWIQADAPGVYRGQCSQFCGAQHAHMAFEVIAQDRAAFDAWRSAQARPAVPVSAVENGLASRGQKLFIERCAGCHTVRGTDASGAQAPDLTHLDTRRLIAAGAMTNTREHQLDWIQHAQRIKPDSLMPGIALTTDETAALSAYLATLH